MVDRILSRRILDGFDWCFLGVITMLLSIGVLTIYSITSGGQSNGLSIYLKQAIWIGIGAVAFTLFASLDYHKLARFSYIFYGIGLLLLIIVMVSGKSSRGAQRWISLGPVAVQPSEFIKVPLLLMLATYYSTQTRYGWLYRVIVPGLMALPGFFLILQQPDLGSSLSFIAIYVTLLLAVGIKSKTFGLVLLSALMIFPFAWGELWGSLHGYQKERLLSFVDPAYDPGGKGYQGLQSRIAVGSGELAGKGLHGGTQTQFKFLPEGHTDFIFAVYSEEWGFLGSFFLVILFLSLFLLGLEIASKAKDMLGALLAIGVVGMLAFNTVVNISMTVGLAPIVGIPLPLMSYGGSATIMTLASLGLLLSVKRRRLTLLHG